MRAKTRVLQVFSFVFATFIAAALVMSQQKPATLTVGEAESIATEAYVYGYPIVTTDTAKQVMTNVLKPEGMHAPLGQFAHILTYPKATFRDVTAPNADTLYSSAWLDLSKEPYILHIPNQQGRYFLMTLLSAWTEVFASPGKRTNGAKAADLAIVGPDWKGTLPEGVQEVHSPTNIVWIIGRTYCTGTPEDYKTVHAIQKKYSLTPLSYFRKPYTPPAGIVSPNMDMKTPIRDQVNRMNAIEFFDRLTMLMKDNPPALEDSSIMDKMAKIGIVPGQPFDIKKLNPEIVKAIESAPDRGQKVINSMEKTSGKLVNGWLVTLEKGNYDIDYAQRAVIAKIGLGANKPEDAVYPIARVDRSGSKLTGKHKYRIHFAKEQLPPVKGFWSITMYDDQYLFVANTLNRYALSPRNGLKYNPDGSLDLYLQNSSPGKDQESNWLPAPMGRFILMMRLYWPEESVLNGSWNPPGIKRVE